MVDSGSQPNVANASVEFPKHVVRESDGQRSGVRYRCADGSTIPNLGEFDVVHREQNGKLYKFTFQNAPVHTTIVSVKYLVTRDCVVTFHRDGGHIEYPDGERIAFVCKDGVFFVALNVLPHDCHDVFGEICNPEPGFIRHG